MADTDAVVPDVSNADIRVASAAIAVFALVKSACDTLSSTLLLRDPICDACTVTPRAPVAPNPRLTSD